MIANGCSFGFFGARHRSHGVGVLPPLTGPIKTVQTGDSIMQFAHQSASASDIRNDADSELHWALFRLGPSGHRLRSHIWYDASNASGETPDRVTTYGNTTRVATGNILFSGGNMGYAGDTSTGVNLRLNAAKNTTAGLMIYAAGTNVGSTDSPVNVVTGNIAAAISYALANSMQIIVCTIRPRRVSLSPTGTEISTGTRDRNLSINDWMRANVESLGGYLWDPWEDLRDPAYNPGDNLYGTDAPGVTRDNVHLAPIGAWLSSRTLALTIARVVSDVSWFNTDPSVSNILTNPTMTGTGGTANNGASGTLPSNCFMSNVSGAGQPVTCVCSVEANPESGGQSIIFDFTSTGAGAANVINQFNLSFTNPTTGFASTDYVSSFFEVEVQASSASTLMPAMQSTLGQSSTLSSRGFGQVINITTYGGQPFPNESIGTGWIATEPLLVNTRTSLNPRLNFAFRADVAGTKRVKVKRRMLRVVPSPVIDFPWVP